MLPDHLHQLIRRHGSHYLAYCAHQPGIEYFQYNDGVILYRKRLGVQLVLGDPICAPETASDILEQFVDASRRCAFAQINAHTAGILENLGLRVTPLGVDNEINPQTFDLRGRRKKNLRHASNRCRRLGLAVAEIADSDQTRRALRPISEQWLLSKAINRRELQFLVRPFQYHDEPGVRLFVACDKQQPLAFMLFDPLYRNDSCEGYTASILRALPDAPSGTLDFILLAALEKFRVEGASRLSLGISPFHQQAQLAARHGAGCPLLPAIGIALLRQRRIYNFSGLAFHKSRYAPREIPTFVAAPSRLGWEFFSVWRACNVL